MISGIVRPPLAGTSSLSPTLFEARLEDSTGFSDLSGSVRGRCQG